MQHIHGFGRPLNTFDQKVNKKSEFTRKAEESEYSEKVARLLDRRFAIGPSQEDLDVIMSENMLMGTDAVDEDVFSGLGFQLTTDTSSPSPGLVTKQGFTLFAYKVGDIVVFKANPMGAVYRVEGIGQNGNLTIMRPAYMDRPMEVTQVHSSLITKTTRPLQSDDPEEPMDPSDVAVDSSGNASASVQSEESFFEKHKTEVLVAAGGAALIGIALLIRRRG